MICASPSTCTVNNDCILCIGKVIVSTGIVENMAYAGLVYYQEKEAEDLVTFTAAKDLNPLLEVNIILFYKILINMLYRLLTRTTLKLKLGRIFYFVSKIMMDTLN